MTRLVHVLMNYSSDRTPPLEYLDSLGLSFMKPFAEMMLQQMLFMDPPRHSRLRSLCAVAFTPRRIEELRGEIQAIADDLLDKVIARGQMDLMEDFANPLPAIVTSKLMGVPVDDHRQLSKWVTDMAEVHGNFQHDPDRVKEILQSLEDFSHYIAARMEELRKKPNNGLIHSLMIAELDGQRLSEDEVIATTIVTIIGGHETTTNLIGSGFLALLRNPECMAGLRRQPENAGPAVEELLRYESPVQHTARIALADTELAGKKILKGAKVVAVLAAANRDPNRFPNPDQLDLSRADNRHLAFGWGAHFCFGAPLTRMEAQIAFNALLRRLPAPRLLDQRLEWRENAGLRGLTSLRLSFDAVKPKKKSWF
jgi:pimeloyl-[acyl-carrier protein] synthase